MNAKQFQKDESLKALERLVSALAGKPAKAVLPALEVLLDNSNLSDDEYNELHANWSNYLAAHQKPKTAKIAS